MRIEMSVMKNIFLVIVVSIVTLKIADISFGMIQPMESLSTSVNRATVRSIVLREFNPNQSAEVSPSNKLTTQADSLKQIPYPVKIDENGYHILILHTQISLHGYFQVSNPIFKI